MYEHYSETIPIPARRLWTISTIAAVLITVLVGTMKADLEGQRSDFQFLTMSFAISLLLVFAILRLTKSVKVSVENMPQGECRSSDAISSYSETSAMHYLDLY